MTLPRAYMAMNLRRAVRPGRVAGRARLLGRREGPAAVGVQALDYTVRSHRHFVLSPIHFIPDLLTYSVPLFLKRQCDRTLGELRRGLPHLKGCDGACAI